MDNNDCYGGNQSWWSNTHKELDEYGCGVVAVCNLEIYLKGKNKEYALSQREYVDYVEERYKKDYSLPKGKLLQKLGLLPRRMRRGLKKFFRQMDENYSVRWSPTIVRGRMRKYIEDMLDKDIPIVASYYVFNKKNKLKLYELNGFNKLQLKTDISSHYFNIVGIETIDGKEYLVISSWGNKYYVIYNQWVNKVSVFTNILYLKKVEG